MAVVTAGISRCTSVKHRGDQGAWEGGMGTKEGKCASENVMDAAPSETRIDTESTNYHVHYLTNESREKETSLLLLSVR